MISLNSVSLIIKSILVSPSVTKRKGPGPYSVSQRFFEVSVYAFSERRVLVPEIVSFCLLAILNCGEVIPNQPYAKEENRDFNRAKQAQ